MYKINRSSNDKPKLCCFGYVDYIVLASSLAIAIAEEVNTTDINILATFFAVLSDELDLIGTVKSCPQDSNSGTSEKNTFVPPIPDTALTRSKTKVKKRKKYKKV